jgi:hypothetical protein
MLAISGLTAESTRVSSRRGQCKDWPSEADKPKVAHAFDTALNDSAMPNGQGPILRTALLSAPVATMNGILKKLYPKDHIVFPKHTVIKFYEPENPQTPATTYKANYRQWYPRDHCIHIFHLPEVGKVTKTTDFQHNLMCCYPPWAVESKRVNKP